MSRSQMYVQKTARFDPFFVSASHKPSE